MPLAPGAARRRLPEWVSSNERQRQQLVPGPYFLVTLTLPTAALDERRRLWRQLPAEQGNLFNHKALAKVLRGKLLQCLKARGRAAEAAGLPDAQAKAADRARHAALHVLRRAHAHRGHKDTDAARCDASRITPLIGSATAGTWRSDRRASLKHRSTSTPTELTRTRPLNGAGCGMREHSR